MPVYLLPLGPPPPGRPPFPVPAIRRSTQGDGNRQGGLQVVLGYLLPSGLASPVRPPFPVRVLLTMRNRVCGKREVIGERGNYLMSCHISFLFGAIVSFISFCFIFMSELYLYHGQ